jgi:signal peptidase I
MRRLIRFLLWIAIVVGVVVGLARLFLIRWWRVPEDDAWLEASVAPTLAGGDLLLLWRLTSPRYGDLVQCPEPDAPERIVVARLAAEAGDRIRVAPEGVWINGKKTHSERNCGRFEVLDPNTGVSVTQSCEFEDLAGIGHPTGVGRVKEARAAPIELEVPPDKVFLLSDNRVYSYDSRDYGLVERATCKEAVVFRLVSRKGYDDVESRFTFVR